MNLEKIEAVIFDLGGVLINLDYERTSDAFKQLGMTRFDETYSQMQQTDLFDRFEIGEISSFHFINRVLDQLPAGISGNKVVHAWNAMILDFPVERLEWLLKLKQEKRIFLLSNTNTLHIEKVRRSLESAVGHQRLEDYFETVYLSCEMGMRKPHAEIFQHVCMIEGLNPATTLFIDDTLQHVEGARKAGLTAVHCTGKVEDVLLKKVQH